MMKNWCERCPVARATGQRYCYGSPYPQAYRCWEKRDESPEAWASWIAAAKAELEFLRDLLPKP